MIQKIGRGNVLYPMPVTLVGTRVGGQPNFINIAHVGIWNAGVPHTITLGMAKLHYTNAGIREQRTFSVNIPSQEMVAVVDYVGLVSGRSTDKSGLFNIIYGELGTAPLIADCPLAMECRLIDVTGTATHDVFVGEIVATYADPAVLTGGKVDFAKVRPLLFDMPSQQYRALGPVVAKAWDVGKGYRA